MFSQSRTLLLLVILALLPALACNLLAEEVTPTAAAGTPDVAVTETATPAPAEPTSTAINLISHEDDARGLTFAYPQSWAIDADREGLIAIASSAELLASEEFDREGAGVIFSVTGMEAFESDDPSEALAEEIAGLAYSADDQIVEGPTPTTINGQEGATAVVQGVDEQSGQNVLFQYTMVTQSDRAVVAVAVTLADYADEYGPILETIANSMRLSAPALPPVGRPEGSIEYGNTVRGMVPEGESSSWSFIGVEGETVEVSVTPLDEQLDVTLDVMRRSGDSILDSGPVDDAFGVEAVRGLTLPASDEYLVVVRGFARASGEYELTLREAGVGGTAQSIAINESVDGIVQRDLATEYSYESGDEGASVTVVVEPEGELDVVVEILDPDGSIIVQEDSSYGREQVTFTAEANTEYHIRVRGFAGAAGVFTMSLSPGGISSNEPGTSISASASLPDDSESGHDFPFTAGSGDTVYAAVEPHGELDVVIEVWNDDSDQMEDQIDLSFGREDVTFSAPASGNYYFKVLGFEGQGGSYTITMTGPPSVIFELVFGDAVEGRFGTSAVIDYVIRLNPGETMQLEASPDADTDVVLSVLDLESTVLAEADEGFSGESELLTFSVPSETAEDSIFFIQVSDFAGEGSGTYTLSVEEDD